jgi:hypothetical protein
MGMACSLQLPHAVCDVNDRGDCGEKTGRDYNLEQGQ